MDSVSSHCESPSCFWSALSEPEVDVDGGGGAEDELVGGRGVAGEGVREGLHDGVIVQDAWDDGAD